MADYIGLRCKVIIKPEYREALQELHNETYYDWSEAPFDFMREYGKRRNADGIPTAPLSYMPDSWEEPNQTATLYEGAPSDGFDRSFDLETGYWSFQCSLTNRDQEIETFLNVVLSVIAQEILHLEIYEENAEYGKLYGLVNSEIILTNPQGVKYTPRL